MSTDNNNNGINASDVVCISDISLSEYELEICKKISGYTVDTWQDRKAEERLRDTCLGKFAEKALKLYFAENCIDGLNPYIAFYDDFRVDDFEEHNSIDFIFSQNIHNLLFAQRLIQTKFDVNVTPAQRKQLFDKGVQIGEIKATRISDTYIDNGNININKILNMDFLTYPSFIRTTSTITNTQQYLEYVMNTHHKTIEEIVEEESNNVADWYFRVFIKEKNEIGKCDAYILGALPGNHFFLKGKTSPFEVKKMFQKGKSDYSIYMAVTINKGIPIQTFKKKYIPSISFPNHLTAFMRGEMSVNDSLQLKKQKP